MKHVSTFKNFVNESLDRLAQLGMTDPVMAAQRHLIRISQETEFPIISLTEDPELADYEESDERYFRTTIGGRTSDIHWFLLEVGIEPGGGVTLYLDSIRLNRRVYGYGGKDPISIESIEDPVPYSNILSTDWQTACDTILPALTVKMQSRLRTKPQYKDIVYTSQVMKTLLAQASQK